MSSLRVGQKVTTDFHYDEKALVRTLTEFGPDARMSSQFGASADAGEPCPTCGHRPGTPVGFVDSTWFTPVEDISTTAEQAEAAIRRLA